MFERVLNTTLLPKNEKIFPALAEIFLLVCRIKNSFKKSFPVKYSVLSFKKGSIISRTICALKIWKFCPTLKNLWLCTCLVHINGKINGKINAFTVGSLHYRCSIKKMFLKILQNSEAWGQQLYLKRLWHRCFPVNFPKFLKIPFEQKTSERLILYYFSTETTKVRQ